MNRLNDNMISIDLPMATQSTARRLLPFVLAVLGATSWYGSVQAAEQDESLATIEPVSQRNDFFGEQQATLSFQCAVTEPVTGKLLWQYSAGARTLARGEDTIQLAPGQPSLFELPITFPPVREGVVFATQMAITIVDNDNKTITDYQQPIWLFPEDPFLDRREWIEQLDIHLYDPESTTAKLFDEAKIPHTLVTNSNVLADFDGRILMVGSGTSLRNNRGLTDSLLPLAQRGVRVLCLSPTDGEFPWPSREDYPEMANVQFCSKQIIRQIDKRLNPDFDSLTDQPEPLHSITLQSHRGQLKVNLSDSPDGWRWWQVRFDNHGTCILCCFDLVQHWESSPTPRFLLARLLEQLSTESHSFPTEQ